jgi:hypothetical protein
MLPYKLVTPVTQKEKSNQLCSCCRTDDASVAWKIAEGKDRRTALRFSWRQEQELQTCSLMVANCSCQLPLTLVLCCSCLAGHLLSVLAVSSDDVLYLFGHAALCFLYLQCCLCVFVTSMYGLYESNSVRCCSTATEFVRFQMLCFFTHF